MCKLGMSQHGHIDVIEFNLEIGFHVMSADQLCFHQQNLRCIMPLKSHMVFYTMSPSHTF